MSCDYQRYHIWCKARDWYRKEVPEYIRDQAESAIQDFVFDWIKDQLEGEGKKLIKTYEKKKPPPKPPVNIKKKSGKGGKSSGKKETKPMLPPQKRTTGHGHTPDDPFEVVYRMTKDIVMPGHVKWSDDQRAEMTEKMRRVMSRMRVHGKIPDADPIHGKHNVPRISSVAAYAVVHDWLVEQGVNMKAPFDPIYHALWDDDALAPQTAHDLGHLIEQLEIEFNKKANSSPEQKEEILDRIHHLSPELYELIVRKFPSLKNITPVRLPH